MPDPHQHLVAYFLAAVPGVFRAPAGCLRHPYLVPGGSYGQQLWDWDSWLLARGLRALAAHGDEAFRAAVARHSAGSWKNFLENQAPNGAVPLLIEADHGDRFDSAREDGTRNQAKPILAQFALEHSLWIGDCSWVEPYFDRLLGFITRWRTRYGTKCGLLVWGSDLAIGMDNDPTIYGRPEFSSAGVLLNCLYARELSAAAQLARELGREADAVALESGARAVETSINAECWDPVDEFFYTVDVQCADRRDDYVPADFARGMAMSWRTLPLKIKTAAGFAPLWNGVAAPAHARALLERHWISSDILRGAWGVRSLAKNERAYEPATDSSNPSNWLGPVWIVTNYMLWEALRRYGWKAEAGELARQTIALLARDLASTGTLHECYHPDSGAPNFNAGFLSWNTLVLDMISDRKSA